MSKRRRRDPEPARAARDERDQRAAGDERDPRAAGAGGRRSGRILRDLLVLAAAFGAAVGVAELLGAANLGVAFGVGQVVFVIVLAVLLTRD